MAVIIKSQNFNNDYQFVVNMNKMLINDHVFVHNVSVVWCLCTALWPTVKFLKCFINKVGMGMVWPHTDMS